MANKGKAGGAREESAEKVVFRIRTGGGCVGVRSRSVVAVNRNEWNTRWISSSPKLVVHDVDVLWMLTDRWKMGFIGQ